MFCLENCFFREVYRFVLRLENQFFQAGIKFVSWSVKNILDRNFFARVAQVAANFAVVT